MSEPTLPVVFANLQGQQPASLLDQNFAFLLGLILAGARDLSLYGTPTTGGTVGDLYIFAPIVLGGTPPYTFAKGGSLPAEFRFNATTGLLWAILSTPGTYSGLSMSVTDSVGNTAQLAADPFTITIAAEGSGGFFPDGSNLADVAATF